MKRWVIRGIVFLVVLPVLLSSVPIKINPIPEFYNTVFMVIGIFYSIGYSIALGFDYSKIENENYFSQIRSEVRSVSKSFTKSLIVALIVYTATIIFNSAYSDEILRYNIFSQKSFFKFSPNLFFAVILVYILCFLVYNFFSLQKLKDKLDDKIRKEHYQ